MVHIAHETIEWRAETQAIRYMEPGRIEVDVEPSTQFNNGLILTVDRTDPDDPIRDIRVLMPGMDEARAAAFPFHPALVQVSNCCALLIGAVAAQQRSRCHDVQLDTARAAAFSSIQLTPIGRAPLVCSFRTCSTG